MAKVGVYIRRSLEDYWYNAKTGEVVVIVEAIQPLYYDPKQHYITYKAKSNQRPEFTITSRDKWFFAAYKKISKPKAILLW